MELFVGDCTYCRRNKNLPDNKTVTLNDATDSVLRFFQPENSSASFLRVETHHGRAVPPHPLD